MAFLGNSGTMLQLRNVLGLYFDIYVVFTFFKNIIMIRVSFHEKNFVLYRQIQKPFNLNRPLHPRCTVIAATYTLQSSTIDMNSMGFHYVQVPAVYSLFAHMCSDMLRRVAHDVILQKRNTFYICSFLLPEATVKIRVDSVNSKRERRG